MTLMTKTKEEWRQYYAAQRADPKYKAALAEYQERVSERAFQAVNDPGVPREMDWFYHHLGEQPYQTVVNTGIAFAEDRGLKDVIVALEAVKAVFKMSPKLFIEGVKNRSHRTDPSPKTRSSQPAPYKPAGFIAKAARAATLRAATQKQASEL